MKDAGWRDNRHSCRLGFHQGGTQKPPVTNNVKERVLQYLLLYLPRDETVISTLSGPQKIPATCMKFMANT